TGFYLDQRLARQRVQELAAGRRVLDLFSYQGAFSLAALRGGASSALAIDQSAPALERASAAAAENGLVGLEVECAEVFAWLRTARRAERRFDLVVLDPPAFAKSRGEAEAALAGYRDLNRLALRLLAPGGYLLSCSCSHHVSGVQLEGVVRQAAAELPFRIILRERIPAAPDHPIWVSLPQSEYLKVLLLQRPCVVPEPPRP
ncbi:MAG: class I SAM-dependent rRNA methyltransferase, partial [Planctomycetes bacterium]|nr:class I SAM-dependent rRNA methyltransferase [Planctomycetota bacterium]